MILEWLLREGGIILSWWLLAAVAGLAALPLCLRLLGGLPDRGYTLARAAGVLLIAFVYWLLASLGFLYNTIGGMLLAWLIVLIAGVVMFFSGERIDLRGWWRENRSVVVTAELVFIVLLLGWAIVRAHQNGISATEKPMELAFTSAVMRSETFPPNDPWMAGYAISYYYFGYVMAAMLSMLSGVPSTTGFNMMIALLFALTGVTAFGVVYNLARSRTFGLVGRGAGTRHAVSDDGSERLPPNRAALLTGLLGMVFVVLMSNYQPPLVEIPYQTGTASAEYLSFWDTKERGRPRFGSSADPNDWDYWWFFNAARVIYDRDLDGQVTTEVIDEFPQFSFVLADLHPHVLSLPFALLGVGLALHVLLRGRAPTPAEIVLYSICLGGLIFLNTWDGPIYMALLVGADGVRRLIRNGSGRLETRDLRALLQLGVTIVGLSVLLYLPFLIGFRSQLGGVLPNIVYPTRLQQYFLVFGPFFFILTPFLIIEARRAGRRMNWRLGLQTAGLLLALLVAAMLLLTLLGALIPALQVEVLNWIEANGGWSSVLPGLLSRRISYGLTALVLLAAVVLVVGRLFPRDNQDRIRRSDDSDDAGGDPQTRIVTYSPAAGFALLLIGFGLVLTLGPEFLYLRDNFGHRMNTVFKLYYQAWALFSVAGAYAVYSILMANRLGIPGRTVKVVYGVVTAAAVALGLVYPVLAVRHRMFVETGRVAGEGQQLTLDGGDSTAFADDYAAVMCFNELAQGDDYVVAEAVGGSYDSHNPPSGLTGKLLGIPNLYNWPGHQSQWRGTSLGEVAGTRQQDIDRLYSDPTWSSTQEIIDRYGIDFIYFGSNERQQYEAAAEVKFRDRLEVVCERGGSRYYRVGEADIVGVAG